jgi:hypothetical protein
MSIPRGLVAQRINDLMEEVKPKDMADSELLQMAAILEGVAERLREERRPAAQVLTLIKAGGDQ